jgi:hypothetical protein
VIDQKKSGEETMVKGPKEDGKTIRNVQTVIREDIRR